MNNLQREEGDVGCDEGSGVLLLQTLEAGHVLYFLHSHLGERRGPSGGAMWSYRTGIIAQANTPRRCLSRVTAWRDHRSCRERRGYLVQPEGKQCRSCCTCITRGMECCYDNPMGMLRMILAHPRKHVLFVRPVAGNTKPGLLWKKEKNSCSCFEPADNHRLKTCATAGRRW